MERIDLTREEWLAKRRSKYESAHEEHVCRKIDALKHFRILKGFLPVPLPERLFHEPGEGEWDQWHQDLAYIAGFFSAVFPKSGKCFRTAFRFNEFSLSKDFVEIELRKYERMSGKGRLSLFSWNDGPVSREKRDLVWNVIHFFVSCHFTRSWHQFSDDMCWLEMLDLFEFPLGLDFSCEFAGQTRTYYSTFHTGDNSTVLKNRRVLQMIVMLDKKGIHLGMNTHEIVHYDLAWECVPVENTFRSTRNVCTRGQLNDGNVYPDWTQVCKRSYGASLLEIFTYMNSRSYDPDFYPRVAGILGRHYGSKRFALSENNRWVEEVEGFMKEACMFSSTVRTFPYLLPLREEPRTVFGTTPLMMAASRSGSFSWFRDSGVVEGEDIELVKMMVEAGCDMETRDNYGRTVLAHMVSRMPGTRDIAKVLIDKGADVNALGVAKDGIRRSVLDHAFYTAFMWFYPKPDSRLLPASSFLLYETVEDIKFYLGQGARLHNMSSKVWERSDRNKFDTLVDARLYDLFYFAWIASKENCSPIFFIVDRTIVSFL